MRAEKQKVLFEDDWNPIKAPPELPPILLVVVDAEEEFDWSAPFSRDQRSVRSMAAQGPMHRIFEKFGIRPTYVVDYPVASQRDGLEPLRDLLKDDACLIGTQLHPWVNPPFDEEVSERNSFPGNLPPDLERAKLEALTRAIEDGLGLTPRIYKAGRYGLGPRTFRTLADLGYCIDLSAVPGADLRVHHGPDFRRVEPQPYWIGPPGRLLELPLTRGYVGLLSGQGPGLEGALESPVAQACRIPGVLSRLGLIDRIILTPEGVPPAQHMALVRAMIRRGQRIFMLSYHSPSLVPGNTPYVRTRRDLDVFMDRVEGFCERFFGELGGTAGDPLSVRDLLKRHAGLARDEQPNRAPAVRPAARQCSSSG
ncbi:polysaccharide deacetylase family protein [Skermanella rosea]|uniref:polysaccharide deacetylase family protein n=1 Tax=Skermanella rosea TaxID=1817965 RepID=UPI001934118C|nr:polysaccharide deacetylase family protein [Skermanella rosea]UEM02727.1 polysaccharide deacetylase family protein [Skermanella rosea]